jgi:hypothetical protein
MAYLVFKRRGRKTYVALRRVEYRGFKRKRRVCREVYLKGKCFIFVGGRGTGKTRELRKLCNRSLEIWGINGVFLRGEEGIENWFRRAGLEDEELKGLKQFEKVELLIDRLKRKAVFIDNVDKVSSKVKVEAVKKIIFVSSFIGVSAENEKRIDTGIVQALRKKQGLRRGDSLKVIELGKREEEVKDIGGIISLVLVFCLGLFFGLSEAFVGAIGLRYLVREGNRW